MSDSGHSEADSSEPSDQTRIIRRHPTGAIRIPADAEPSTSLIGAAAADAQTGYIPRARPVAIPRTAADINPRTAIAAAVTSILSG